MSMRLKKFGESFAFGAMAVFFAATLLTCGGCETSRLDSPELRITLVELRSQAAQMALIAEALLSNGATFNYFQAQLSLLGEKTEEIKQKLKNAKTKSQLREKTSDANTFSQQINDDLIALLASPEDHQKVRATAQDLRRIVEEILQLEATVPD